MFLNTFTSTEDQLFQGKYNNKVPPKTDRQGPLESLNGSYDKSSRVRLSKPQHNKGQLSPQRQPKIVKIAEIAVSAEFLKRMGLKNRTPATPEPA